jgi:hypothetical protein
MSAKPGGGSIQGSKGLTVFLTGDEFGQLKPCGCTTGQLGGLEKRSAVLNSVPASKRLIVDTGSFVKGAGEQDIIKFKIILQAFNLLDYDLVNLKKADIETARDLGLVDVMKPILGVISSYGNSDANVPARFTKELSLKNKPVAITVAAFDANAAPVDDIKQLFAPGNGRQKVNILILNSSDSNAVASIAEMGIVDCLICPSESDEAILVSEPNARPLIVSVGRYGRYVGRLQIEAAEGGNKLKLRFSPVPVTEDLLSESSLVKLYQTYQQWVKDANLLEEYPRYVLPGGLEYTGSESCKGCHEYHEYEYEKWSKNPHAGAYATLEKVGSQFDPECVVCHVVGMTYESGFVSEKTTPHLKDVGCENCHGPGSEHIKGLGYVETTEPKSVCTDCHTPEHSAAYEGNEQLYLEKIIHWREPNAPRNVKNKGNQEE